MNNTENTQQIDLLKTENEDLRQITARIKDAMVVEKIICYSSILERTEVISCFLNDSGEQSISETKHYGLLIIPGEEEKRGNSTIQQATENLFDNEEVISIVHRMDEVNMALKNGSTFFANIYKNGFLLYDREQLTVAQPATGKTQEERLARRTHFWNKWHALAKGFIDGAHFYLNTQNNTLAIYMLHQATQHALAGVIRVLSGYRSNSNSLQRLCRLVATLIPQSPLVLPKNSPKQARLTGLLLKGFSDTRYNEKFEASNEEVVELTARTERLLELADTLCCQKLADIRLGNAT
ncbi:HEPN domain-containing protein [Olivibacter sitiensis]|uniref:HEPN domain-containing protein n=1 Tax=Olivibacter sitiensis TaxID=376470 RepID=UPI0003FE82DF|nr:HEPN domain-containing protein [Olivibacter sitiensis]